MRLAQTAGGFVRTLARAVHADLCSDALGDITNHICLLPVLADELGSSCATRALRQSTPGMLLPVNALPEPLAPAAMSPRAERGDEYNMRRSGSVLPAIRLPRPRQVP